MKKIFLVLLVLALAVGLYAGGGSQSSSSASTASNVAPSSFNPASYRAAPAGYEISILTVSATGELISTTNPAWAALEQHTGYKIRLEMVFNANYNEQMNTRLAARDLPGLVAVTGTGNSTVNVAAQYGAFWDITDVYGKYANLAKADKNVMNNIAINGRYYGIYRERTITRQGMVYRSDWLDKLGLAVPTTLDELYTVLRAFTYNDPDGNGQRDTFGFAIPAGGGTGYIGPIYDIVVMHGAPNVWGIRNGKLTPWFEYAEFMAGLNYVKKLYDEGIINPDFASMPTSEWTNPIRRGQAGWHLDVADEGNRTANGLRDNGLITQADIDAGQKVWVMGTVGDGKGNIYTRAGAGHAGYVAVSTTGAKTLQDLHYHLDFMNKSIDEIGVNLMNWGTEGTNYNKNPNGTITSINAANIPNGWNIMEGWNQFRTLDMNSYQSVSTPIQIRHTELYREDLQYGVHNPVLAFEANSSTWMQSRSTLDQLIFDACVNYVMGTIDVAGFNAVKTRWYSENGQKALDELQVLYDRSR